MRKIEMNIKSDKLILTRCNKKAAEQCYDVVSHDSAKGSILFVYGPSPSGKTQLLSTCVDWYLDEYDNKPCVVTFNQLISDLVAEIKNKEADNFIKKYTSSKLLLIDDVQQMLEFSAIQKVLAEALIDIVDVGVNVIFFSGYKLSGFTELFSILQDKKIRVLKEKLQKADIVLRRELLECILSEKNISLTKREFWHIVRNRKIVISSFNACICKIALTKKLEGDRKKFIEIVRLLKEYER